MLKAAFRGQGVRQHVLRVVGCTHLALPLEPRVRVDQVFAERTEPRYEFPQEAVTGHRGAGDPSARFVQQRVAAAMDLIEKLVQDGGPQQLRVLLAEHGELDVDAELRKVLAHDAPAPRVDRADVGRVDE